MRFFLEKRVCYHSRGSELKKEYLACACALDLPKGWHPEKEKLLFTQTRTCISQLAQSPLFPSKTKKQDKLLQAMTCERS